MIRLSLFQFSVCISAMEELLRRTPVKKGTKETSEEKFLHLYNESYAHVEQGICFDEVGHTEGAKVMYERSLKLIEEAEKLPEAHSNELYGKMNRARQHIRDRLAFFAQPPSHPPAPIERGTSTMAVETEAIGTDEQETVSTPTDEDFELVSYPPVPKGSPIDAISGALMAMGDVRNAEEIFAIPDGVQIFYIKVRSSKDIYIVYILSYSLISGRRCHCSFIPLQPKNIQIRHGSHRWATGFSAGWRLGFSTLTRENSCASLNLWRLYFSRRD